MLVESTSVCTDAREAIRERVIEFLESRGYRQDGTTLTRGSWWGTLASLNPRKWAAKVTLESLPADHHQLRFEVNTTGHPFITDAERKFWEDELSATRSVLGGGVAPELDAIEAEARATGFRVVKYMLSYSFAISACCGLAQYLLFLIGVELPAGFAGVGAGLGIGVGMQKWRASEEKKKLDLKPDAPRP